MTYSLSTHPRQLRAPQLLTLLLLAPLLLAPLLLALTGCGETRHERAELPLAVRVTHPKRMDLAHRLPYLATLHAKTEVQIIAQIQGSVIDLPHDDGDRVRKGEMLFRLDAPEIESTVQRLQTERDYWCDRSRTDERLFKEGAVPEEQLEAGKRACANAESALNEASARLRKAVERASMNGIVLRHFVETGQHVMPGQPMLLLGDDKVELRVDVVEEDLQSGITVGTPVQLHISAEKLLHGSVREIAAHGNMPSRTFTVKIDVNDATDLMQRYGTSLPVDFITATARDAIALPVSAIADPEQDPHVYLMRDDRVYRQTVETGIQDRDLVEVRFPWNGSDLVAVSNLQNLHDSASVIPVDVDEVRR